MSGSDENKHIEDDCSELSDYDEAAAEEGMSNVIRPKPHIEPPRFLTGFWTLPHEVQSEILSTASGPPLLHRSIVVGSSLECTKTIMRLASACKAFRRQLLPRLYENVRLPNPSTLAAFQRVLAARPALGRLVKRLHIGPEGTLHQWWWPLNVRLYADSHKHDYFWINLVDSWDDPRRPRWTCPSYDICMDRDPKYWPGPDVYEAFQTASRDLDLDLQRSNCGFLGSNIGSDAWHVRVMELQAAIELWALETRRWDDEAEKRGEKLPDGVERYPRLVVEGCGAPSQSDSRKGFYVSRAQLYSRMARRGCPTDDFNHPLLFARSGICWRAKAPNGEWHTGGTSRRYIDDAEDVADAFAWPTSTPHTDDSDSDDSMTDAPFDLCDPLDAAIPATATVGGNLALARTVLSLTPLVQSLSLTGFLDRALVGERPACHQALLRTVNLGPPPLAWSAPLNLTDSGLNRVERLRICGAIFDNAEIDAIGGNGGALSRLRDFHWTLITEFWPDHPEQIIPTIDRLIGLDIEALKSNSAVASQEQRRKRGRSSASEGLSASAAGAHDPSDEERSKAGGDAAQPKGTRSRPLYIEASLHPEDAEMVVVSAPSAAVSSAWCSGERVPGQRHRFQLFKTARIDEDGHSPLTGKATQVMLEQGRTWWEQG